MVAASARAVEGGLTSVPAGLAAMRRLVEPLVFPFTANPHAHNLTVPSADALASLWPYGLHAN